MLNKIQESIFKELIDFNRQFMSWAASHLGTEGFSKWLYKIGGFNKQKYEVRELLAKGKERIIFRAENLLLQGKRTAKQHGYYHADSIFFLWSGIERVHMTHSSFGTDQKIPDG